MAFLHQYTNIKYGKFSEPCPLLYGNNTLSLNDLTTVTPSQLAVARLP